MDTEEPHFYGHHLSRLFNVLEPTEISILELTHLSRYSVNLDNHSWFQNGGVQISEVSL